MSFDRSKILWFGKFDAIDHFTSLILIKGTQSSVVTSEYSTTLLL